MFNCILFFLMTILPVISFAQPATDQTGQNVIQQPVIIDTKVVEILLNDEHRKGIDWEAIVSDYHSVSLKKENNPVWADKKYRLSMGQVTNEDYMVLLDALDTVGHFIQEDFPQVSLLTNETKNVQAKIELSGMPSINIDYSWILKGDIIKLKIKPTIEVNVKESTNQTQQLSLWAQSEFDIKDKSTIVIGGLFHEQEISKVKKFPLLGDLPIVGLVFRKQGKLMQKTETVIFITVHANAEIKQT